VSFRYSFSMVNSLDIFLSSLIYYLK